MNCEVLIRATDGSNKYRKGFVVAVKDQPCAWGTAEGLPDFVRLIVTDCMADQVLNFLDGWEIKFRHTILQENDTRWWKI